MVQLLINDVHFAKIQQDQINIDRTANDPIPTCSFVLQDDGSQIALSELMELVFVDESQIANPTHNFVVQPLISPYTTTYTQITASGGSFANLSPGVQLTAANAAGTFGLAQTTQNGLVVAGQNYMLSCTIATTTLVACTAYLSMTFQDATGASLGQQITFVGSGATASRINVQGSAPAGTATIQVGLGMLRSSSTNSGSATFTSLQLEAMSFTSGNYQLSYPTAFCATGQSQCQALPDGTTVRQYRLFGGYITKATAGKYIGLNRQWKVTASGYAWLLQKQLLNTSWTNQTDAFIIGQIVSIYFPNVYDAVSQVAVGATLDNFGYTYNGYARDAVDALAQNAGFFVAVDAYRTIIYQPPGYNTLGFMLSDQPDNVMSFPYYDYTLDTDGTQLGNATLVTGASNISAVEYDAQSIGYYNQRINGQGIFWRTVNDSTITTTAAARQRAIAENATYNYARKIAHLTTQQLMIPGYTVLFSSTTDSLYDAKFVIQKATLRLIGFQSPLVPTYECVCDLGDFNPDGVNVMVKMLRKQQVSVNSIGTPVIGLMVTESMTFVDSLLISRIVYSPSTYGSGIYGHSTYAASFPSVPTTTYGTGKYGDNGHGYN